MESTKHGPQVHGPSVDQVHQNVDWVHEPPFMERIHGPLFCYRPHINKDRWYV